MLENDLTRDLLVLEGHLNGLFDAVRKSGTILKNFQSFEMRLFSLDSLAEMFAYILDNAKDIFDLDFVSLSLIDDCGEIARSLDDDFFNRSGYQGLMLLCDRSGYGHIVNPYVGSCDREHFRHLFAPFEDTPASIAITPLYRRGKYLGTLNLGSRLPDRFITSMSTDFITHLGIIVSMCLENRLNIETIRRTSYVDTLTGVNNRRFLEQRIGEELDRCFRNQGPLTCMFLDIDYFKSVNDKYGHQVGDKVLSTVAKTIKSQLRNNDVLARYGGEEFVALLTDINESKGFEIAERIRRTVQSLKISFSEITIPVTLSIGLSTYLSDKKNPISTSEAAARLIKTADFAMYRAKNKGRNRIEFNEILSDSPQALIS